MIEHDLKRLTRAELLELLIEQTIENERLREQIREMQDKLLEKRLICDESGSIAEAAIRLNGVFEAAQAACDQYIENIKLLSDPDAVKHTEEKCNAMIEEAKERADAYWAEVQKRVEELTSKSPTLKKLLEDVLNNEEDDI
ncbi:MAG: hypothetical protein IJB57_02695 [Clostridia bacterium]|nr:hypothetical protein [Clostridia bacterium]